MNKTMGLILIIVGAVILTAGIILVSRPNNTSTDGFSENRPHTVDTIVIQENNSFQQLPGVQQKDANPISRTTPSSTPGTSDKLSSKQKGDLFEDFTVNLLADWRMKLLDRTQDKMSTAGVVAESCRQPDLHIQQKRGKSHVDYYMECKYRSDWHDGAIKFEDWQIKRYREFQRTSRRKVIIALGIGGTPSRPATLMLVPLDSIKENTIKQVWVNRFAIHPSSDALAKYIDNYFDEVFAKTKGKPHKTQTE